MVDWKLDRDGRQESEVRFMSGKHVVKSSRKLRSKVYYERLEGKSAVGRREVSCELAERKKRIETSLPCMGKARCWIERQDLLKNSLYSSLATKCRYRLTGLRSHGPRYGSHMFSLDRTEVTEVTIHGMLYTKKVLFFFLFVGWKPLRPIRTIAGLRDIG